MHAEKSTPLQNAKLQDVLDADAQHCISHYQTLELPVWDAILESRKPLGAAARSLCEADFDKAAMDFDNAAASMEYATKIASNRFAPEHASLAAETNAFRALAAWMRVRAAVGVDVDRVERYAEEARGLTMAALSERDARTSIVVGWADTFAKAWADRPSAKDATRTPLVQDSLLKLGTVSKIETIRQYLAGVPSPRPALPPSSGREISRR